MRLKASKFRLTKKRLLMALVSLLVVLITSYVAYSILAWRNYNSSANDWVKSAHQGLDTTLRRPVSEQFTTQDKRSQLAEITTELQQQSEDLCDSPALIDWQIMFAPISQITDECHLDVFNLQNDARSLQVAVEYLDAEARLASIIDAAYINSRKATASDLDWQKASQTWQVAVQEVNVINGGEAFEAVRVDAKNKLAAVADNWQQLIEADSSKNEAAFESARTKLVEAYDKLPDIGSTDDDILSDLI